MTDIVPAGYTNYGINPYAQQVGAYLYRNYGPQVRDYVQQGAYRFWGTRNTRNIRGMSKRKPIDLTGGSRKRARTGKNRKNVGKYRRWSAPGAKGGDLKYQDLVSNESSYSGLASNPSNQHLRRIPWSADNGIAGALLAMPAAIITGNGPSARQNQRIVIKSIQIVGTVGGTKSILLGQNIKMYLVLDKQCNGEDTSAADVWTPGLATGLTGEYQLANLRELGNSQRFEILKEWNFNCNQGNDDNSIARPFKLYHKCNIPIEYDPEASTSRDVANLKSNNLTLFATSDNSHPFYVHVKCRLRFADK